MLAVFTAVADRSSFTDAARVLNRSPAAVTRAIATLEATLNVRLLNRTTRSVSLTEAGQRTLDTAKRLLATAEELEAAADAEHQRPRGTISVTASSMFGRLHVLPLLTPFLEQYRDLDVRLLLLDRIVSLVDEGLDLGVRLGHLPDSALRSLRVGHVRRGVYASPAYLARAGMPATPQALGDHEVVTCLAICPVIDRWTFPVASGSTVVAVKPRLALNTPDPAVSAAVAGVGLTMAMSYQVAEHIAAGRLVEVLADFAPPPIPIHLVQPAGRYVPPKLRLLTDHLAQGLRAKFAA